MKPNGRFFRIATSRAGLPRAGHDASRNWALLAGACAFALAAAAAPAESTSETGRPQRADVVSQHEPWRHPDHELADEAIVPLRRAAQVGNVDAALAAATRLVDRFERGGAVEDLFEATIWIDRYHGNEAFARSGLLARVQQRDCRHRVLQLHWLCDVAE